MMTGGEQRRGADEGAQVIASYKNDETPKHQPQSRRTTTVARTVLEIILAGTRQWRICSHRMWEDRKLKTENSMNREGSLSLYSDVLTSRRGRRRNGRRGWWWRSAPLGSSQRCDDRGIERRPENEEDGGSVLGSPSGRMRTTTDNESYGLMFWSP
jgi:hypothetical protein